MIRLLFYVKLIVVVFVLTSCAGNSPTQDVRSTPKVGNVEKTQPPVNLVADVQEAPTSTPTVGAQPAMSATPTATPSTWIPRPLMGVEAHHPEDAQIANLLLDSGSQVVRYGSVIWYEIESQEGQYNWNALQEIDAALQELSARGFEVILIVRGTPGWAQMVPGAACGPITSEKFSAFADFMAALVHRYSDSPYNVKYWEIGNEPDVAPEWVLPDSGFGCWGDSSDVNYGGGHYADMLKVVYPAMKAADPDARVLIGGLLLDCDPFNPPADQDCRSARFFNGILANNGKDFFDGVSFHGYTPYRNGSVSREWELPAWSARGGVIIGKINYLKEVMQQYGADKPIFLTETSLNCPEWNQSDCQAPDDQFFEIQADYVVRLFVRNWALGISGTTWYDFEGPGWRYGGFVGEDPENPKPVFRSFRFLNEKLNNMAYVGKTPFPEGVEGYIFSEADHQTWVIWSRYENPQTIDLPSNLLSAYDKYGQEVPLQGPQLTIVSPIYFDIGE